MNTGDEDNRRRRVQTRMYFYLFISTCMLIIIENGFSITVTVKGGQLAGFMEHGVTQFLGVPYAEPPLGNKRFKKPVPRRPWAPVVINCTQYGNRCPELRSVGRISTLPPMSEDCLTLNVFIPGEADVNSSRAVMVWIHGGGYRQGTSRDYDLTRLSKQGDVIIVSINYRLNSFGFLTTGDKVSPGNYGLWDQHLSFLWVKENIASFGGDVNRITIFGASSGGFSVSLHALSPLNTGLFHRVIAQSGTSLSPMATLDLHRAVNITYWFSRMLGCGAPSGENGNTRANMVQCLRNRAVNELLDAFRTITNRLGPQFTMLWAPVVDGELIARSPADVLKDTSSSEFKFFSSLDYLAGCNDKDGAMFYFSDTFRRSFGYNSSHGITSALSRYVSAVTDSISTNVYTDISYKDQMEKALLGFYTSDAHSKTQLAKRTIDLLTDAMFFSGTIRQVHAHVQSTNQSHGASYLYMFSHPPDYSPFIPHPAPSWFEGATHIDERMFLFGLDAYYSPDYNITHVERLLSEDMMAYWTNFAKTGKPNRPNFVSVLWPQYKLWSKGFINLTIPRLEGRNLLKRRDIFWSETLPVILSRKPGHFVQISASVCVPTICVALLILVLYVRKTKKNRYIGLSVQDEDERLDLTELQESLTSTNNS